MLIARAAIFKLREIQINDRESYNKDWTNCEIYNHSQWQQLCGLFTRACKKNPNCMRYCSGKTNHFYSGMSLAQTTKYEEVLIWLVKILLRLEFIPIG